MSQRIQNLGDEWPFPTITDAYRGGDRNFFEVSERVFDEQLACLPPIYDEYTMGYTIFRISEEWDTVNNEPIHTLYIQLNRESGVRYFCKMESIYKRNNKCLCELYEALGKEE
jgi:hypothetical protein